MSSIIDLTAIVTPRSGQTARFLELFQKCAEAVAQEPGTLIYELRKGLPDKNGGKQQLVIREVYADPAGQEAHMQSAAVKSMIAAIESGKLVENIDVIFTGSPIGARSKL
ncbi:uncharacterized protein E0L32_011561 [Thyridium curvatum]|uniref:ABM domain-containing protein n=1 Tax=Thyridium curvatum TaxID=1093900 RepID=A0A507BG99_9PEZI|nr:uncharacterized protein E0L32_011561 [Thyridium curvatum]TPX18523.1 hypothetical protein E0L32_011561 [Thyridium curvatum]